MEEHTKPWLLPEPMCDGSPHVRNPRRQQCVASGRRRTLRIAGTSRCSTAVTWLSDTPSRNISSTLGSAPRSSLPTGQGRGGAGSSGPGGTR